MKPPNDGKRGAVAKTCPMDFEESSGCVDETGEALEEWRKWRKYNSACKYMLRGNYLRAYSLLKGLGDYENSASLACECEEQRRLRGY